MKKSLTICEGEHPAAGADAARLLDELRKEFGDGLVCGINRAGLAWLLEKNARQCETLAPLTQLDALQSCLERVVEDRIAGDVIEAGCFRGGQCVLMSGVLKALGALERRIFAADSFSGLPEPDRGLAPDDAIMHRVLKSIGGFAASAEEVRGALRRYDLLDERVEIIAGWFRESLPRAPITWLALIRLDATFYQSTRDALEVLYPKLSPGGFVIAADYGVPTGARRAVDEYRMRHGVGERLTPIDMQGVMWRRTVVSARAPVQVV